LHVLFACLLQVRAQGEDLIVQHHFTIDATPPATTLTASFLAPSPVSPDGTAVVTTSDTPAGVNPSSSSASDAVSFAFTAEDLSPVKFECLVTRVSPSGDSPQNGAGNSTIVFGQRHLRALYGKGLGYSAMLKTLNPQQKLSTSAQDDAPPLGQWSPCVTPVTLLGVSFGNWVFSVRATDAAGNLDVAPSLTSWSTRYTPGQHYVRAVAGDYGLVNHADLKFDLMLLQQGEAAGSAPEQVPGNSIKGLEWALVPSDTSPLGVLGHSSVEGPGAQVTPQETATARWTRVVPWVSHLQLTVPKDGSYNLLLRPVLLDHSTGNTSSTTAAVEDSAGVGTVPIVVDSTPPLIKVTSKPAPVQGNPSVTVKFESVPADDAVSYSCRWIYSNVTAPTGQEAEPGFGECKGAGQQLGVTAAATDVRNGYWMFQVSGIKSCSKHCLVNWLI
jgi:hypothetical protein